MEDKLHWMYGFWLMLSGWKSFQAFLRLAEYRRMQSPVPVEQWLLAAFWSVAVLFYGYMIWRKVHPRPRMKDRRRVSVTPLQRIS